MSLVANVNAFRDQLKNRMKCICCYFYTWNVFYYVSINSKEFPLYTYNIHILLIGFFSSLSHSNLVPIFRILMSVVNLYIELLFAYLSIITKRENWKKNIFRLNARLLQSFSRISFGMLLFRLIRSFFEFQYLVDARTHTLTLNIFFSILLEREQKWHGFVSSILKKNKIIFACVCFIFHQSELLLTTLIFLSF